MFRKYSCRCGRNYYDPLGPVMCAKYQHFSQISTTCRRCHVSEATTCSRCVSDLVDDAVYSRRRVRR